MSSFLLFMAGAIGLTLIIVESKIFAPIRELIVKSEINWLNDLITCYQCCGFWSGILVGLIVLTYNPLELFVCGCAASFLSLLGTGFLEYLNSIVGFDLEQDE